MPDIAEISPPVVRLPTDKDPPSPTDEELLRTFARTRSNEVFAQLMGRHIKWVYSVALRQVVDRGTAEDATLAVFAALARKSDAVARHSIVSGWLFRAVRYAALDALKLETRRKKREWEAMMDAQNEAESDPRPTDPIWERFAPLLDEGLAGLGEADRRAILLRFYEQRGWNQVGRTLGVTEDAARVRVTRALDKLRRFLGHRGLTVSVMALGGLLVDHAVHAAPPVLAAATLAFPGSVAAPPVQALATSLLRRLSWRRAGLASLAALPCVLLLVLLFTLGRPVPAVRNPSPPPIAELAPALRGLDQAFMEGNPDDFVRHLHFPGAGERVFEPVLREYIRQVGLFRRQAVVTFHENYSTYHVTLDVLLRQLNPPASRNPTETRAVSAFAQNRPILLIQVGNEWKWDLFEGLSAADWNPRMDVLRKKSVVLEQLTSAMRLGTTNRLDDLLASLSK